MKGDWFPVQSWRATLLGAMALCFVCAVVGLVRNEALERPLSLIARPPQLVPYQPGTQPSADGSSTVFRTIALDQAAGYLFDPQAVFLDARVEEEYVAGHIEGALNLAAHHYDQRFASLEARLRSASMIVVYCDGGACESSLLVARRLMEEGFMDVLVFPGGWPEWTAAGYPTAVGK